MQRRVVVTGLGLISPLSASAIGTFNSLCNAEIGISEISESQYPDFEDLPIKIGGFLPKDFDLATSQASCGPIKNFYNALSLYTSKSALEDSNFFPKSDHDSDRIGVIHGCDKSSPFELRNSMQKVQELGYSGLDRFLIPKLIISQSISTISIPLKIKGYCNSVSAGYATGQVAVSDAFRAIKLNYADVMVAGACEVEFDSSIMMSLYKAGFLARSNEIDACKPFDITRDGMVYSVGAGALIVEELKHALDRGAKIYAEIIACANVSHTKMDSENKGPQRVMDLVISKAGVPNEEIDLVCADASGLIKWDLCEANAIEKCFPHTSVTSHKGNLGHLMSASGICQSIITALAIHQQTAPPIANLIIPVNENLNYIVKKPTNHPLRYSISNSFTYDGGCFSSILFKHYQNS